MDLYISVEGQEVWSRVDLGDDDGSPPESFDLAVLQELMASADTIDQWVKVAFSRLIERNLIDLHGDQNWLRVLGTLLFDRLFPQQWHRPGSGRGMYEVGAAKVKPTGEA